MTERENKQELEAQEEEVRREAEKTSGPQALGDEMREEMENKSPGQSIKDDLKAVGQDLKDKLSRNKGSDR